MASGGIFKSVDGGTTWQQLAGGLPAIVQAYVRVAPSNPKRLIANVASTNGVGIYRSDDAGATWTRITNDPRPATRIGGGDTPVPAIDPKNPDTIYVTSIVTWKSTDGGKTWTGIRGAPGGDDYQNIWINPDNPDIILLASDQGAIITVNRGATWSSWYNQPTAQMYHVNADNAFPYRLCGGQQESGSACVSSRGDDGQITFREWHPAGSQEYAWIAPDPLNPDMVYGAARSGVTQFNRKTGQSRNISPTPIRAADFRTVRTAPLAFSPVDPHTLYFGANTLWKTRDGGNTWTKISPDLSRKTWDQPATLGKYASEASAKPTQRGVIYSLGLSPLSANRIWAGTDDGLIHTTADGGAHWKDVTPPALKPFQKVAIIDAGHFDANTAYAAINTFRLDDMNPHIYRTHDGGNTWTEIVKGIPAGAATDVVREDPKRKGLLFAGTEQAVYVSFDDGDNWQSLRQNMPATSIRDLIVKDDDLAVATHGRGFWIFDDITALRQLTPEVVASPAFVFKPETAVRIRWNMNTDTPLPPDEPGSANPPDGAVIDYYLGASASGAVTLEILDRAGAVVRRYSSQYKPAQPGPEFAIPTYWLRPAKTLASTPGLHRFVWDLHYEPLPGGSTELPIAAILGDTAPTPNAPWVMPGNYTVKLTAGDKTYAQPLVVKLDPRVHSSIAAQGSLSKALYDDMLKATAVLNEIRDLEPRIASARTRAGSAEITALLDALTKKIDRGSIARVNQQMDTLMQTLQSADMPPTVPQTAAVTSQRAALAKLLKDWKTVQTADVPAMNAQLVKVNLAPL